MKLSDFVAVQEQSEEICREAIKQNSDAAKYISPMFAK